MVPESRRLTRLDETLHGKEEKSSRPRQIKKREKTPCPSRGNVKLCCIKEKKIQSEGITNLVINLAEHENNPIRHKSFYKRVIHNITFKITT